MIVGRSATKGKWLGFVLFWHQRLISDLPIVQLDFKKRERLQRDGQTDLPDYSGSYENPFLCLTDSHTRIFIICHHIWDRKQDQRKNCFWLSHSPTPLSLTSKIWNPRGVVVLFSFPFFLRPLLWLRHISCLDLSRHREQAVRLDQTSACLASYCQTLSLFPFRIYTGLLLLCSTLLLHFSTLVCHCCRQFNPLVKISEEFW